MSYEIGKVVIYLVSCAGLVVAFILLTRDFDTRLSRWKFAALASGFGLISVVPGEPWLFPLKTCAYMLYPLLVLHTFHPKEHTSRDVNS